MDWGILKSDYSVKEKVRRFYEQCVDSRKLSSMDEAVATATSLVTAILAVLAILFESGRVFLGVAAGVSTVFFWVGYRVAKILHSIELRVSLLLSFTMFSVSILLSMTIGTLLFPMFIAENSLYIIYNLLTFLIIFSVSLPPIRKLWKWLTNNALDEWTPWSFTISYKEESFRRQMELSKFLETGIGVRYAILLFWFGYGVVAWYLIYTIVDFVENSMTTFIPFSLMLILVVCGFWIIWNQSYNHWYNELLTRSKDRR